MRGLLRDYADFELASDERERVDEHVHQCRDCGVALSRIEAEVFRIRRVMTPMSGPSAQFVQQVMARVRAAAAEVAAEAAARAEAEAAAEDAADEVGESGEALPADFTPRVMERIRREWRPPSRARQAWAVARRAAVPGLLLLAAGLIAALLLWQQVRDDNAVSVLSARLASLHRGAVRGDLRVGAQLAPGDVVAVGSGDAAASLLVREPGSDDLDAAVVDLEPDTGLAVLAQPAVRRGPAMELRLGGLSLQVLAAEGFGLLLQDGTRLEFERGRYRLFTESVVRHDVRLAAEARALGVRLAVLQGRASVLRDARRTPVDAGYAALFDTGSSIMLEPLLQPAELVAALSPTGDLAAAGRSPADPTPTSDCVGRVIFDRTGAGVAGVALRIRTAERSYEAVTAADGSFRLEGGAGLVGAMAIVRATLPESSDSNALREIANFEGALRLASDGPGRQREPRLAPIRLPADRGVAGVVLAADGSAVAGARVTPYLIDRVLERATPMSAVVAATTERDGRFALRRLAAEPPLGTDIVLLVEHAEHGALAALDLTKTPSLDDRALQIMVPKRTRVSVASLPPHEPVQVLASIKNLAPRLMLTASMAVAGASGIAEISVGEGASLWMRRDGRLVALAPAAGTANGHEPVDDAAVDPVVAAVAAAMPPSGVGMAYQRGGRYDVLLAANAGERRLVSLLDASGQPVASAQMFFVSRDRGAAWFLGETLAADGECRIPANAEGDLLAVDERGAVGVLPVPAGSAAEQLRLHLLPPGSAGWPEGFAPQFDRHPAFAAGFMVVELRMEDGPLAGLVVHRPAGRDTGWVVQGLIPGNYSMRLPFGVTGRVVVPPGGRGQIQLAGDPQASGR